MKTKLPVRDMALAALGAALIAACSWISVPALLPGGVPFTLQTFAVCLLAALYGWKLGLVTVAVYLLLGAAGAPVFAGFKGGVAALLGTTGGYLLGFVFTALIVGLAADKLGRKLPLLLCAMVLGLALCYAFGTAWFIHFYAKNTGPIGLGTALSWCVLPFLVPDGVKLTLAALLTGRLYPMLQKGRRT
jgi:biotin transport system substrate-specific component